MCAVEGGDVTSRLKSFGAVRIVVGSPSDLRPLMSELSAGDVLAVTSLDHLSISMWHVLDMLEDLRERHVSFVSLDEGVDTRDDRFVQALDMMRALLDAERRLVSRRSAEARMDARSEKCETRDRLVQRSRLVAAPWIGDVLEHRPHVTWDRLVDLVARQGGPEAPSPSLMRRHVRRLVEAGEIPSHVMSRTQRTQDETMIDAGARAREMAAAYPDLSLREIGLRLEAEGLLPPRAETWSAQTVKRLLRP